MTKSKAELEKLTPYEIRKYNAFIHGYKKARAELASVAQRVWKSRRGWQDRAIDAEKRLALIEALCMVQELMDQEQGDQELMAPEWVDQEQVSEPLADEEQAYEEWADQPLVSAVPIEFIYYAIDPEGYEEPADWERVLKIAAPAMRRMG